MRYIGLNLLLVDSRILLKSGGDNLLICINSLNHGIDLKKQCMIDLFLFRINKICVRNYSA
jgi:hypothetical protein